MATNKTKTKKPAGEWYLIKNTVTGEKSIADAESFAYAQEHEPKAWQWKKVSTHSSEAEALKKL